MLIFDEVTDKTKLAPYLWLTVYWDLSLATKDLRLASDLMLGDLQPTTCSDVQDVLHVISLTVFVRTMLASAGISCRRVSQVGVLLKRLNNSRGPVVFWCWKSLQNSNGLTPNRGTKSRWGKLNAGVVAENWQLSTQSISARLPWYSVSCGFVSKSWSLSE